MPVSCEMVGRVGQRIQKLADMGQRSLRRPRKRWFEMLKEDMKKVGVTWEDAFDRNA